MYFIIFLVVTSLIVFADAYITRTVWKRALWENGLLRKENEELLLELKKLKNNQ